MIHRIFASAIVLGVLLLAAAGCSDESNPLAAFEPEIVNTADAFQFQATDVDGVTTSLDYSWTNGKTGATINHSTALTGGTATVMLFDGEGTRVYTSGLMASATETCSPGTAGTWTVRILLSDFHGTANFRVEPL